MTQDHQRVWIPDNGATPFVFENEFAVRADLPDEEVRRRLSTGDTPGSDGEYTEPTAPRDARVIVLKGRFNCALLTDLQARFDTLAIGVPQMRTGKLVRRLIDLDTGNVLAGRYLRLRPVGFRRSGETGLPSATWEIEFRTLGDKVLYYEETPQVLALNVPGAGTATTAVTLGGVEEVRPVITFEVTTIGAGGSITVSHNFASGYARFSPSGPGTWKLDFDADSPGQSVTYAGLSQLSLFDGSFPPFVPQSSIITIIVGGGVVVSSAQITWHPMVPFA